MAGGVETAVETARPGPEAPAVELRLVGPMALRRDGTPLVLPPSRKVRALLAYLALAPRPQSRSRLCELLWDVPNDPRGELRWCLSKIRGLVDAPGRRRVETRADTVRLDLSDCAVDAVEIARAVETGIAAIAPDRLRALVGLFAGDFLEGLEVDRSPSFAGWLATQRRRFRQCHVALLERLAACVPEHEALGHLEQWLSLAPFDLHAHTLFLGALARHGRIRDGEEHLAAAARLFEDEGLDSGPLRDAWRPVRAPAATAGVAGSEHRRDAPAPGTTRRTAIAVMPFADRSAAPGDRGGIADALTEDVITRLAKLRSLFVIARGTVFALDERRIGPEEAGRMLNVDYVVGGAVRCYGGRLTATVELAETRTARIVWTETFDHPPGDALLLLNRVGDSIVASVAGEIETIERNRAILRPPETLDAWTAHHRGLWHMYRFNRADNERARQSFETATHMDPTFSRPYAGLSFTHFQDAFQGWAERGPAIDRAFDAAGRGLMADDRDPAAHWAMGRALWLRGSHDGSVVELRQAVELSPNFALAHYTLAFVHSQTGDPAAAITAADHSRALSPFDPLLFGMLGARAMALVRLGRFDEAAEWGVKAAARPNAHAHILAIAAFSLALAGRLDEAGQHLAAIRRTLPRYRVDDFLAAMRFAPGDEALFRKAAKRLGAA